MRTLPVALFALTALSGCSGGLTGLFSHDPHQDIRLTYSEAEGRYGQPASTSQGANGARQTTFTARGGADRFTFVFDAGGHCVRQIEAHTAGAVPVGAKGLPQQQEVGGATVITPPAVDYTSRCSPKG